MKKYIFILLLFVFLGGNTGVAEEDKLNQAVVRGIVERFTSLHYAQEPLNDELSKRIFQIYLDSLDSGHYYFLESDVKEFRARESSLDDMLRRVISLGQWTSLHVSLPGLVNVKRRWNLFWKTSLTSRKMVNGELIGKMNPILRMKTKRKRLGG